MLLPQIKKFEDGGLNVPLEYIEAKNGSSSASYEGIMLHSKYNPEREAEQLVSSCSDDCPCAVFLAFGLGYAPIVFAKKHPDAALILVEKDPVFLFAAFATLDWQPVLEHSEIIFAVDADVQTASSLIRPHNSNDMAIFSNAAWTSHDKEYFETLRSAISRDSHKNQVNTNTLEKFSRLWLRNSCKNLPHLAQLGGVKDYFGIAPSTVPFVVLAAGPSLETILPHLAELKKRAVLICVDTALRACLNAGVEPDFIVLVDPQYACARHVEFLSSPTSVLIAESAVWPSVFRFNCREIVLCSSLFPIGQYFERHLGQKGALGAGGSVATTAWDFARKCGAKKIYMAGMDLGFPGKQTHIRGSQFEERSHRLSKRTNTAESDGVNALFSACPKKGCDYNGNEMLTDERMSIFSWWFENSCATAIQDGQETLTLTPQSLAIKGIKKSDVSEILSMPPMEREKEGFFIRAQKQKIQSQEEAKNAGSYQSVLNSFKSRLQKLRDLAKKGRSLCKKGMQDRLKIPEVNAELSRIDAQILSSDAKDAAALVFPTERQLKELSKNLPESPELKALSYSDLIYTELNRAIEEYLELL